MCPCLLSTFLVDKTRQHSTLNGTVVALTSTAQKRSHDVDECGFDSGGEWSLSPTMRRWKKKITAETGVAQTGVAEEHVAIKVLAENVSSGDEDFCYGVAR